MAKEKGMKTAKELNRELSDFADISMKVEEIIGKKIMVLGSEEKQGKYGYFHIMKFRLGKKEYTTATGSKAILKLLENGQFPFEGTIVSRKSKTRKGESYYAFE